MKAVNAFGIAVVTGATLLAGIVSAPSLPAQARLPVWTISDSAVTRVVALPRAQSNRARRVLGNEYLNSAVRLSDGRLVVGVNGGVRIYDARGTMLYQPTRAIPNSMYMWRLDVIAGDSIVGSGSEARIVYSPDGQAGRVEGLHQLLSQTWMLPNGDALGAEPHAGGYEIKPYDWYLLRPRSHQSDDARVFLGTFAPFLYGSGAFIVYPAWAQTRDRLFFGVGTEPLIHVYSLDGKPLPPIRLNRSTRKVTKTDIAAYWSYYLARPRLPYEYQPPLFDPTTQPHAKYMPYYHRMTTDVDDNIWLEDYAMIDSLPSRWTVLTPAGKEIAHVTLPGSFQPTHIGRDYITGIDRSKIEQNAAVIYRLKR